MQNTVFYSWQSDIDPDCNRNFLSNVIKSALKQIRPAHHLEYDEATRGLPGTPDIPKSIFDKIEHCAVGIFDVTCIKKIAGKKGLMNPNVAIELGFAAHAVGWDRVILVLNSSFGSTDYLPFHLKHKRFPLVYSFPAKKQRPDREPIQSKLAEYITAALASQHAAVARAKSRLSVECVAFIHHFGQQYNFNVEHLPQELRKEVGRMIDIGLIRFDVDPKQDSVLYSYHWTPLGRALCDWYHNKKDAPQAG